MLFFVRKTDKGAKAGVRQVSIFYNKFHSIDAI